MPLFLNEKQDIRTQKLEKVSCTTSTAHRALKYSKAIVPLENTKEVDILKKLGV